MTNSPEATTPDSPHDSTTTDAAASATAEDDVTADAAAPATAEDCDIDGVAAGAPAVIEGETFDRLVEPRSENRLVLAPDVWHQISPKYVRVQLISVVSWLLVAIAATLALVFWLNQSWAWIPGAVFTLILLWSLAILPRQARSIGYQLRDDDLVFRRGILWQRFVAVPYGRMQLVDITHGPLDRGFGIAQLKFVTAAATTGVVIPGLEQRTAETLRDHLVAVAESRRTGL